MVTEVLVSYAASIRKQLLANPTNIEQDLAPVFKTLLEKLLSYILVTDLKTTSAQATAGASRSANGVRRHLQSTLQDLTIDGDKLPIA